MLEEVCCANSECENLCPVSEKIREEQESGRESVVHCEECQGLTLLKNWVPVEWIPPRSHILFRETFY